MVTSSLYEVTRLTGINTMMLRGERPLSAVFPLFIKWVATTTAHVSDTTGTPHYPGKTSTHNNYITYFYLHSNVRSSSSPQRVFV